jgi:hypothetical protein
MFFLHNALTFQVCLFVFGMFINNIDALQGTKKRSLQKFGILPLLNFISSCLLPKSMFFCLEQTLSYHQTWIHGKGGPFTLMGCQLFRHWYALKAIQSIVAYMCCMTLTTRIITLMGDLLMGNNNM